MNNKIGCEELIKTMRVTIQSIMEPIHKSVNEGAEPFGNMTNAIMLWDEADFVLDELRFLMDCLRILEKRTDNSKDEAE